MQAKIHHGSLQAYQHNRTGYKGISTNLIRTSYGLTLTYKLLMLLKNKKLLTICNMIGGTVKHKVPTNILLAPFVKKGLIFNQATRLCTIHERYNSAAVEDRYHPYPSKLMKQNVPCDIARKSWQGR